MSIVEFFKKFIEVKNNDLSFLKVGDIIWARRYKNDKEKQGIKYGHQESPYVIIKKEKNKVLALQCTSNPHQEIEWKMPYYPLGRLNYELSKNTFINCLKVYELKEIQFVETIGHLCDYDLNQLKKQLYILINSNFKMKPNIKYKDLKYKIGVGDVIVYNNYKYYIYLIDEKYLYLHRMRKYSKRNDNILINNNYYSFIFNKIEKIKIKDEYDLVDTFNTGEIELIKEFKEKYLANSKNECKAALCIGTLINYKERMYYIYKEDEEYYYCFQIYSNEVMKPKMADVIINKGIYKTFFATIVIEKEKLIANGYKIKRYASKNEIEYNKKIFHLPVDKRSIERKKINKKILKPNGKDINDFVPMTILINEINNSYYLVINKKNNVIEVVNIDNISDSFYFELEQGNCPFKFYRVLGKEEYDKYLNKINELKEQVKLFNLEN